MNVLLIGGTGSVMNHLINKMRKEGHRIYLLTGSRYKYEYYEKVFERYDFPYNCDSLGDIFDSIKPDVMIYTGAFDTNYKWKDQEKDAVRYMSGFMSILIAYSTLNRGRFIYLSDDEVYSGRQEGELDEETAQAEGGSLRSITLGQCESVCLDFQRSRKLDILILRVDHLCNVPENRNDRMSVCATMALEAIGNGTITYRKNASYSIIHESDVIQFISQMVWSRNHRYSLYNLSSSQEISEKELAEMVQAQFDTPIRLIGEEGAAPKRVLSNKRFDGEFGLRLFSNTERIITDTVTFIKKNEEHFITGTPMKKTLWERLTQGTGTLINALVPILENLLIFILCFVLNNVTAESQYCARLDFYLLYVLLFAIVYGQRQATLSAVLAAAGYFIHELGSRTALDVVVDFNTYVWIAQLFIVGLVVGYLKDQILVLQSESGEEREYLSEQIVDIHDINTTNIRVKDSLETQIVNQNDSVGKIYNVTSGLEQDMPDEVLFHAAEILSELMDTKDVAIYIVSNRDYARLFTATSAKSRELGNSIRYRELGELYKTIADKKVYINKKLDDRYPLMANALFEGEEMQMILMLWGLHWEAMTLGQANIFFVISSLIQDAALRASRYISVLENERYIEGTTILEKEAFTALLLSYQKARDKMLTEYILIRVDLVRLGETYTVKDMGALLRKNMRQSDYIGVLDEESLYILLTNTTVETSSFVMNRLLKAELTCKIMEEMRV